MQNPASVPIEHEAANLRTLRRLSASKGPGSLPLDPDLPIPRVPNGYLHHNGSGADAIGQVAVKDDAADDDASSDSSHLFWLPAHLHPELAPAEFRAFLQEHTSSTPSSDPDQPLARSLSRGKSLGRQKSMLSRQYRPSANDGVENESSDVVPTRRNIHRTLSSRSQAGPSLSANDLQTLEFLADEAAKSGDPTRLRSVLKRSISMNHTSVIDQMDNIGGDEADEPIVVPQPSQSLKRSVRTKIRKASLQGTGGGHRFPATRRGKVFAAAPDHYIPPYDTSSSESHSVSDHPEPPVPTSPPRASFASDNDERDWNRPLSYSEEAAIYDSYADRASMEQDDVPQAYNNFPPSQSLAAPPVAYQLSTEAEIPPPPPRPVAIPTPSPPSQPPLQHPAPRHHLPVPSQPPNQPIRSTSPGSVSDAQSDISITPSQSPTGRRREKEKEREKEKKSGLFGKSKWGGEKNDGKIKKDKPKAGSKGAEKAEREAREKESGFFGSLFGGKKKSDESAPVGSGVGPATAAALLGQSRSKSSAAVSPEPAHMGYARYPIHVERAVYRLSHIKLANPRRPLHEQVLISNLMFWYLGIINKPATTPAQPATPPANQQQVQAQPDAAVQAANEERERERHEKERLEYEQRVAQEKEQQEQATRREQSAPRKSLNKAPAAGDPRSGGSGRKAEMPVKGPQYGMGMVIEQGVEYDVQNQRQAPLMGQSPAGYEAYARDGPPQPSGPRQPRSPPPPQSEPQPIYNDKPYQAYDAGMDQPSPRNSARSPPPITRQAPRSPPNSLPPGAMPPVSDHSWLAQSQLTQAAPSNRGPNPRGGAQEDPFYQQPPQARSIAPQDQCQEQPEDPRQQRSPPPGSQQNPPSVRHRSPSYSASSGGGQPQPGSASGRPKTAPVDPAANAKLQGRSLSASAVPSPTGSAQGRDSGRSRSPPPGSRPGVSRSRSKPREETATPSSPPSLPPNGVRVVRQEDWQRNMGGREEEDLPLAVYQRQQQQQQQQQQHHPQYYPQQQPQDHDWNYPRR